MRIGIGLILLLCISACGGPKYVVKYHYLPPTEAEGRACLKKCDEDFLRCEKRCEEKEEACQREARQEASRLYQKLLEAYQEEVKAYRERLSLYRQELVHWNEDYRRLYEEYLFFKKACKKEKDDYACKRRRELERSLKSLEDEKPSPPKEPQPPKLEEIQRELAASCKQDCRCQKNYDHCFLQCGGKIIPERFCLEGCSQGSKSP